jgi:hypothetical protein
MEDIPKRYSWQPLWFILHLAGVYVIAEHVTPWLSGWTAGRLLPLFQYRTASGPFQFLFSHLFVFSTIPAFLFGLLNARFKHKAPEFVWCVPACILAYKFLTFHASSVFANQFSGAFHQYFGNEFFIPGGSWRSPTLSVEEWGSPDILRGLAQLRFTAPFYAGIAYSVASWIGRRTDLNQKVTEKIKTWEESRFDSKR